MTLNIKNLTISLGDKVLLKNFSINVNEGEFFCVIGESGAGKTIALKTVLNLLSGDFDISFDEFTVLGVKIDNLQQLNIYRGKNAVYIPQNSYVSFDPYYSIGWQIVESILLHNQMSYKDAKNKALELLRDVNLMDVDRVFNSKAKELSGGMAQRAMIAMMIACSPKLVIADEITSALDYDNKENIIRLLKDYMDNNNATVIFVTHELDLAVKYADKNVVMRNGEIVDRCDNLENSTSEYTKKLLSCLPENLYLAKQQEQKIGS